MLDSTWLAVNELVHRGLDDYGVVKSPPSSEEEVWHLAEMTTDHAVASVEQSVEQQRAANQRRRNGR